MKKAGKVEKEKLKSKSYSKIILIVILLVFVLIAFALVLKYPTMTGNMVLEGGYNNSGYALPELILNSMQIFLV